MKKHTKIYLSWAAENGIEPHEIMCEHCNRRSTDIHHLSPRGMGGSKSKDYIENLMALCRDCHLKAESDKAFNEKLKEIHLSKIKP